MARPASRHPTDAELEILNVLWESGPTELGQVRTRLRRDLATTTVATVLKVMLEKGLVRREQGPRGYLWSAKVGRKATAKGMLRKLLDGAFDGSARRMVAHLIEDGKLTDGDMDEIRRMLDENRGGKGGRS